MKIMFNEDWIHFLWTRYENNIDITENVLKEFIYQYKDTQVTDFAINMNGTVSTYPSKTRESFCDKFLAKEENGVAVDYSDTYAKKAYEIFIEKNLDMYKIWIDTLREIGIRPWISFRMNDCHGTGESPELRKSSYVDKHRYLFRIRHRETNGYYDKIFDYSLEETQKYMLDYMEEILTRYKPDGIELDFTREAMMFRPGYEREGTKKLNEFIFKVKELARRCVGDIPINILVMGSVNTCLQLGLDVPFWAKTGLINSVVLLPRWETINTDYEIGLWKKLLGDKILIGGGQQLLVKSVKGESQGSAGAISNIKMAFGQAAANLYNGCDFVYLYNYMDICETGLFDVNHSTSIRQTDNLKKILKNAGEYKTAIMQERSHVLTYDDYPPFWQERHARLPVELGKDCFEAIKINIGEIREEENAFVILGFSEKPENVSVYVNCKKAEFDGFGGLDENITRLNGYRFRIDKDTEFSGYAIIEIKSAEKARLEYAEITII